MRSFNQKEEKIINIIRTMASNGSFTLKDFFEKMFFLEKEGRALIIQTIDNYSVLYLKKEIFESQNKKNIEIEQFLELVSLINYLNNLGLIHFFPTDHLKKDSMFFVQDQFNNPQPSSGNIILNNRGDYTSHPENILDKNDEIIYKGVFIDDKTNTFLATNIKSNLFVSKQLHALDAGNKQKNKSNALIPNKWLSIIINTITLLMVGFTIYFLSDKIQNNKPDLSSFKSLNIGLKNNLDSINVRLKQIDSIHRNKSSEKNSLVQSVKSTFYGIDISHYNESIVEKITLPDTISFVICKATEGLHFRDSYFDSNWKSLKEKGITRGAYHFYHIDSDPIRQAKHYLSVVQKWESNDIIPIVDIEDQSFISIDKKKVDKEVLQTNLLRFLSHIENVTKMVPMIYVDKNFANTYLIKKEFSKYPLWLAEYTNKEKPIVPIVWEEIGFKIWQKTSKYHFKSKIVDFDIFHGDLETITKNSK